jgi:hypothetical protein
VHRDYNGLPDAFDLVHLDGSSPATLIRATQIHRPEGDVDPRDGNEVSVSSWLGGIFGARLKSNISLE